MFSNIELPLGYNIMALEYVLVCARLTLVARTKVLALPLRAEVLALPRAQVLELALCAEVLTLLLSASSRPYAQICAEVLALPIIERARTSAQSGSARPFARAAGGGRTNRMKNNIESSGHPRTANNCLISICLRTRLVHVLQHLLTAGNVCPRTSAEPVFGSVRYSSASFAIVRGQC